MKISEILKKHGLFRNDIKQRLKNGQIKINGDIINYDIDLNVLEVNELGDWLFNSEILKNKVWTTILEKIISIEILANEECNVNNDLTNILRNYKILRFSKKDLLIIKYK